MVTRVRTLDFLPEIFKTETNKQFLNATLDQLVQQPSTVKIEGYIGSKFGYGVNANDKYVVESSKTRTDYQLDPAVVLLKPEENVAKDFISYPGIIDGLRNNGAEVQNNNALFENEFYSWDSFCDLDKLINFSQYYWLPKGPDPVAVSTDIVFNNVTYTVNSEQPFYNVVADNSDVPGTNPTLTLLRGGTYRFVVNQTSQFWIQGSPNIDGIDPNSPNFNTREILGVSNNGINQGVVTFNVPLKNAQDFYNNLQSTSVVDIVSTIPFAQINNANLKTLQENGGIDGVYSFKNKTIIFINDDPDSDISKTVYQMNYTGPKLNPTVTLTPNKPIPVDQITNINFGDTYSGRQIIRYADGTWELVPYLSANLNELYYRDSTVPTRIGKIKLIENTSTNFIDVENDILGQVNYTSPNGVKFTNGLKINFAGQIFPESYKNREFYVEGVGTNIQLLDVNDFQVPETFSSISDVQYAFDVIPFDSTNYDGAEFNIPTLRDYITISRASFDKNAWSRSNRWFHIDVINATAQYNKDTDILQFVNNLQNKAQRPIIEFYPNLKLFKNGTEGRGVIDLIETTGSVTDALSQVNGQTSYSIDNVPLFEDAKVVFSKDTKNKNKIYNVSFQSAFTVTSVGFVSKTGSTSTGFLVTLSFSPTKSSAPIVGADFYIFGNQNTNYNGTFECKSSTTSTITLEYKIPDTLNPGQFIDPGVWSNVLPTRIQSLPAITLTEYRDSVLPNQQIVISRGQTNTGLSYFYNGTEWISSQLKQTINQPPLFDVFNYNGVSFGDSDYYNSTNFVGNGLFGYGVGVGVNDSVLGFPLKYSSVNNIGDISFDVLLNKDNFSYVNNNTLIELEVDSGYVHQYSSRTEYNRKIGWEKAKAESYQYQVYNLVSNGSINDSESFTCDIRALDVSQTVWPSVQVYINNARIAIDSFTYTTTDNSTIVTVNQNIQLGTPIEILILSDQTSNTAYYEIPINLSNNPFNTNLVEVSVGDIRGHFQSIYKNFPNFTGSSLANNNYRDLGNIVGYGTKIVQHSSPIVFTGMFLRNKDNNLFEALDYNGIEYIKFKTLLLDVVNRIETNALKSPSDMLDSALDEIANTKDNDSPFFWTDMVPSRSPYIVKRYKFNNERDTSVFPLSKVYDFSNANYDSVLVYLNREINGLLVSTQLIKDVDYSISVDSPSVTVFTDLQQYDVIIVKEYNQTYGSYVPYTPTKLGLYPSFKPEVIYDDTYVQPTYFIRGHDGSYNRLYGEVKNGLLVDFRDKVLLEFETRIFNNIKVDNKIPLIPDDVIPGEFRTTEYSYDQIFRIYSLGVLNWLGQNRIDYKTQYYSIANEFTYNYNLSSNRLDKTQLKQGFWRGLYRWFYDTDKPHLNPWEMLGLSIKPTWWEKRYGPAPYTSDNDVLWTDLANGYVYNDGNPYINQAKVRPNLKRVIPVDSEGNLLPPLRTMVGNFEPLTFNRDWTVGDVGPAEYSYLKSSTYPFDLIKLLALTKPAKFFALGVDLDRYVYNSEFDQYLFDNRYHINPSDVKVYGNGTAKHSYINFIVDYQRQFGLNGTETITTMLNNVDVRLVYRLAGFSDKDLLKFYIEKGTPNSSNTSLLIPDESYRILLYDNEPFDRLTYSAIIIQRTNKGFKVYGNSQTTTYFKTYGAAYSGRYETLTVGTMSVKLSKDNNDNIVFVPYGTEFLSIQTLAEFMKNYGVYLTRTGMIFDSTENGLEVNWNQMIVETMYWAQTGWIEGSVINVNPAASQIKVNKENNVVQPLTLQRQNFVLNQNLVPIQSKDMSIVRDGTELTINALNAGDSLSFFTANISNVEHGIVFDNTTSFNDIIYNLATGLRQQRILVKGIKTAEWQGYIDAQGFILNQDNIEEWQPFGKYSKGVIVKYKNSYYIATKIVQPNAIFNESEWVKTDYNNIQKGLLPNPSLRAFEATKYYDVNQTNLENDADLLSFSSIGYRPRDYLTAANLSDITQVNVYKNLIKGKGTANTFNGFQNAALPQGVIDYDLYENWAIKNSEFGGVLNNSYVELSLDETLLTGNPATVGIIDGYNDSSAQQKINFYNIYNYNNPIINIDVLPTTYANGVTVLPYAGYVNFDDVKMASYNFSQMGNSVDKNNLQVPINKFYKNDYAWLANYNNSWNIFTPISIGLNTTTSPGQGVTIVSCSNNLDGTVNITFNVPHSLKANQPFMIINFNQLVDGYYIVQSIVNLTTVKVKLNLDPATLSISGTGLGIILESQRVSKTNDIVNLNKTNFEFTKQRVWVDEAVNSEWAVYQKSLNYKDFTEFTNNSVTNLGRSVCKISDEDYLIATDNRVIWYTLNQITNTFEEYRLLPSSPTTDFGITLSSAGDLIYIGTGLVNYVYKFVKNSFIKELVLQQTISSYLSNSYVRYAVSGDKQYWYMSAIDTSITWYVKDERFDTSSIFTNLSTAIQGQKFLTASGDQTSTVVVGDMITTTTYASTTELQVTYHVISAVYDGVNTTFYLDRELETEIAAATSIYKATVLYTILTGKQINFPVVPGSSLYGYSIATNYDGTKLFVGSPNYQVGGISGVGKVFEFDRLVDSFIVKDKNTQGNSVVFTGSISRTSSNDVNSLYVNGVRIPKNNSTWVANSGSDQITLYIDLNPGDIITAIYSYVIARPAVFEGDSKGENFGYSVSTNTTGSELIVGAPYKVIQYGVEGIVYRFTNAGKKFGIIKASSSYVGSSSTLPLLINGYRVDIPPSLSNIEVAVTAINNANLPNIQAYNDDGYLVISLIDNNLNTVNNKINIISPTVSPTNVITVTGFIDDYSQTQELVAHRMMGASQFGAVVKFNEYNSFVVSAPVENRVVLTTFDFTDDANQDNDTIFDNNFTQFIDVYASGGSVYLYDYLPVYNENINNVGSFILAQTLNSNDFDMGSQPKYGNSIDFKNYDVVIGAPNTIKVSTQVGKVFVYRNSQHKQNWGLYRSPNSVVDINKLTGVQLYDKTTNNTLEYLDYIDPLAGKLLGVVRENIDYITGIDPAGYSTLRTNIIPSKNVWGKEHEGKIWFDISLTKFMDYHQNDLVYNSKYWGKVFPGSTVTVYTWVENDKEPSFYEGPGIPYDLTKYTTQFVLDASNNVVPKYYYWVRNTGVLYSQKGKTITDSIIASYIANPQASGISFFAPLSSREYGLYNSSEYIQNKETVLHIGYSAANNDDVTHQSFLLLRDGFGDDFLPGLPLQGTDDLPKGLYRKLIDSLSGVDQANKLIPNIYLPIGLRYGTAENILQTMFVDRFTALKNYVQYINNVLSSAPFAETVGATLLTTVGPDNESTLDTNTNYSGPILPLYDTTKYWEPINYWAEGYSDSTKASFEVPGYYDLETVNAYEGLIVNVAQNSNGYRETYIYTNNQWLRIGLENGTILIKPNIYDYNIDKIGFGDGAFDISGFDDFPSEETRLIVRAFNEQITIDTPVIRNKGLMVLFNYIVSESLDKQNYLPWLNKTSFVDVSHTVRELLPFQKFQKDNQVFLEGYLNEVKPYHVIFKDFLFKYTGIDTFAGDISDFDVPATYDSNLRKFISPVIKYITPTYDNEFFYTDLIWQNQKYSSWYNNYGLSLTGYDNFQIARLGVYLTKIDDSIVVDNVRGFPVTGTITIDQEVISYAEIDYDRNRLTGLTRGINGSTVTFHFPGVPIFINLSGALVLHSGRGYAQPPRITAVMDTLVFPEPKSNATFVPVMSGDKLIDIIVTDPGYGYPIRPKIQIEPSYIATFTSNDVDKNTNTITVPGRNLINGDTVFYTIGENTTAINGLTPGNFYFVKIVYQTSASQTISLYVENTELNLATDTNKVIFTDNGIGNNHNLELGAVAVPITSVNPVRSLIPTIRLDRTSYTNYAKDWVPGTYYIGPVTGFSSSSALLAEAVKYPNISTGPSVADAMFTLYIYTTDFYNSSGVGEGVITYTTISTTVTGVNTEFTKQNLLGKTLRNGSGTVIGIVDTITSDTELELLSNPSFAATDDQFLFGTQGRINASTSSTTITGIGTDFGRELQLGMSIFTTTGRLLGIVDSIDTMAQTVTLTSNSSYNVTNGMYAYGYGRYDVTVETGGSGYSVGDIISIPGTEVNSGQSPVNDIRVYVSSVGSGGEVLAAKVTGPATFADDITLQPSIPNLAGIDLRLASRQDARYEILNVASAPPTTQIQISFANTTLTPSQLNGQLISFYQTPTYYYGISPSSTTSVSGTGAKFDVATPVFTGTKVSNEYYVTISEAGTGYNDGDTIIINGSLLGGVDGVNDLTIKVIVAGTSSNEIVSFSSKGTSNNIIKNYYAKVISDDLIELYNNSTLTSPVPLFSFIYTTNDEIYQPGPFIFDTSIVIYNKKFYICTESNNDTTFDFNKWEEISVDDHRINALDRIAGLYEPTDSMVGKDLTQLVSGITYPYSQYKGNAFSPDDQYALDVQLKDQPFNINSDFRIVGVVNTGTKLLAAFNFIGKTQQYICDGVVNDYTFSGIGVALSEPFFNVVGTSTNGTNAKFNVFNVSGDYTVQLVNGGAGYTIGTTITILGTQLGGSAPANNLTITVTDILNGVVVSEETDPSYSGVLESFNNGLTYDIRTIAKQNVNLTSINYSSNGIYFATADNPSTSLFLSYDGENWVSKGKYTSFDLVGYDTVAFDTTTTFNAGKELYEILCGPMYVTVGDNISVSQNGIDYTVVVNDNNTYKSITYAQIPNYNLYVAVGHGEYETIFDGNTILQLENRIIISEDTINWTELQTLGSFKLNSIASNSSHIVIVGDNGNVYYTDNPYTYAPGASGVSENLNSIAFGNNKFISVGDNNTVIYSTDNGVSWTAISLPYVIDYNDVYFDGSDFYITGENLILRSTDYGVTWEEINQIVQDQPIYDIKGNTFLDGYGPEELVPGVVSDDLSMYIKTRPGSIWGIDGFPLSSDKALTKEYNGFFVNSKVGKLNYLNEISFKDLAITPSLLSVYILDQYGLGRRIYENIVATPQNPITYTIDWVREVVILSSPILSNENVLIDIYEIGNGNQISRTNTKITPLSTAIISNTTVSQMILGYKFVAVSGVPPVVVYHNGQQLTYGIGNDYYITNDGTGLTAITFTTLYDTEVDFLSVTTFQKSTPQIFYSIPETELFEYSSGPQTFTLANTYNTMNLDNMIVEINGIRLDITDYSVTGDVLTVIPGLISQDIVSVTTFGDTTNQGLLLQTFTGSNVCEITVVDREFTPLQITTDIPHGLTPGMNHTVRIEGCEGSVQLNNQSWVARAVGGSGTGALFDITKASTVYTVTIDTPGTGYNNGDEITIAGTSVGGATPANDITLTVGQIYNGVINTFTPTGTSIVGPSTFNGVSGTSSDSEGIGATFDVTANAGTYTVTVVNKGVGYRVNTVITILGTDLGGATPANDLTITVNTVDYGVIAGVSVFGTASAGAGSYNNVSGSNVSVDNKLRLYYFYIDEVMNLPITGPSVYDYLGNGYVWLNSDFQLVNTTTSSAKGFQITVGDTKTLVQGAPIKFVDGDLGFIQPSKNYYIKDIINSTQFTLSEEVNGNEFSLTPLNVLIASTTTTTNLITLNASYTTKGFTLQSQILFSQNGVNPTFGTTSVNATNIVKGQKYKITSVGTTDFIVDFGADDNVVGVVFIATENGTISSGTGTVDGGLLPDEVYYVKTINSNTEITIMPELGGSTVLLPTSSGTMDCEQKTISPRQIPIISSTVTTNILTLSATSTTTGLVAGDIVKVPNISLLTYNVTAGSFVIGQKYRITTLGTTTDWNIAAGTTGITYNIGDTFIAAAAGSGNGSVLAGLLPNEYYYIKTVPATNQITVAVTSGGNTVQFTTLTSNVTLIGLSFNDAATVTSTVNVTQWNLTDVDKLYVTVDGERISSTKLRMRGDNYLSILSTISSSQEIMVGVLGPYATPNENIYRLAIDKYSDPEVYRVNGNTTTWLVQPFYDIQNTIYVNDVRRLLTELVENTTVQLVNGNPEIQLHGIRPRIVGIEIFNNSINQVVSPNDYSVSTESLTPVVRFTAGVAVGDILTVTVKMGNEVIINGEKIAFLQVNYDNNSVSNLIRGIGNTGQQFLHPIYSRVYNVLPENMLDNDWYSRTWNSAVYSVNGDPLQISNTYAARFLKGVKG